MTKPTPAASRPWLSACCPSVAETWDCEIGESFSGRAPYLSWLASAWADLVVKPPEISEPDEPSIPGVLREVDLGHRDELVVQGDREVLVGGVAADGLAVGGDDEGLPALDDGPRDPLPLLRAAPGEAEGDVRPAVGARAVVEVLLGVLDVGAREGDVVAQQEERVGLGRVRIGVRVDRLLADEHGSLLDLLDHRPGRCPLGRLGGPELPHGLLGPGDDLLRLVVDEVELVPGGGVEVRDRRAAPRAGDRVVERERPHAARVLPARDGQVVGRRLAVRPEDVLLPVVELELGHRPDHPRRLVGVRDVRERDDDLVGARALDLRLGHPERVDALAHDVDRAGDRVARDLGRLRRLGLVDELDAALEVQAQARRLRREHHRGAGQEGADEDEDQDVAPTVGHRAGLRSSA